MSLLRTRKHAADQARFARWDALPEQALRGLELARLKALQTRLQGYVVLPGEADYDKDRRIWYPEFNPYPLAIVFCTCENDVALCLELARDTGLPFTIRSGGHCTAGFSSQTGKLLFDLSLLDDVHVDTTTRIAVARPGCTWASFDKALDTAGLHVPGGECGEVCVGGYVQGGGYGYTSVTFGMNCDNVIDMRVMLADGSIVVASATQNTDLWWAMRGGTGGNFGVLLQVRYQLRPLAQVFGWALIWPLQTDTDIANAAGAMMALQSGYMLQNLDPNLNIQVSLAFQPGIQSGLPLNGPQQPYLLVRGLYVGDQTSGQAAIQPLCDLPGCTVQWTKMDSFLNQNNDLLNLPYPMPSFPPSDPTPFEDKASRYVTAMLSQAQWEAQLRYFTTSQNMLAYFYMEFYGGAINGQRPQLNAFVHRSSAYNAVMDVFWFNDEQKVGAERFLEGWIALMEPAWNGEIYQNYPRLGTPGYGAAYWGPAQVGLYAVKLKYDPTQLFRFDQQVGPIMAGGGGPGPVVFPPPWLQAWIDQPIVYDQAAA